MLIVPINKENINQNNIDIYFTPARKTKINKTSARGNMKKREPPFIVGWMTKRCSCYGNQCVEFSTSKNKPTI